MSSRVLATLALLVLPVGTVLLGGCAGTGPGALGFDRQVLHRAGAKLGCVAIGELDAAVPGDEVVATDEKGRVHLIRVPSPGGDAEPFGERIAELGGEAIQCAVGDADYGRDGLEIVTVGMVEGPEQPAGPGRAHIVWRDADGSWRQQAIFDDAGGLLHAVAIHDGQVFVGGFSNRLYALTRTDDGWRNDLVAELPGPAKNAIVARGGVVVACADGSLVLVTADGGWSSRVLHKRDVGRARLAVGADDSLLCADDDGTLTLLPVEGEPVRLYKAMQKLRGAWLGDLDPQWPGQEAVTAGYGRRVWMLWEEASGWESSQIREEADRIHHVAGGDLDGQPGVEIVTVGFAGEVVMLKPR